MPYVLISPASQHKDGKMREANLYKVIGQRTDLPRATPEIREMGVLFRVCSNQIPSQTTARSRTGFSGILLLHI